MKGMKKMFKALKGSSSRGSSHQQDDDESSQLLSRRHSVSEMGSSGSRRSHCDQGLRGCSSRFSVDVEDVMEPVRRPRTHAQAQAQVPQAMNVDDDDEEWEYAAEGFSLRSSIEEQRYKNCKERMRPNLDIDYDFMRVLDFEPNLERTFANLGWSIFAHISANFQKDLALEIMTTMDLV